MESSLLNIALVSDDKERLHHIKLHLQHTHTAIFEYKYKEISSNYLDSDPFDLIVFDCKSRKNFDYKDVYRIRSGKVHAKTPFFFILSEEQFMLRREIFKDEHSGFLKDPFDKFEFLSQIRNLVSLGQLEKRAYLYEDVLEGEKKLIYYLDRILEIPSLGHCTSEEEFYFVLQSQFTRRMELTFAVEKVLFLQYDADTNDLVLKIYGDVSSAVTSKNVFNLATSEVKTAFLSNGPVVFEGQLLLDPFVQELEESLGFEIHAILFSPLVVLHQPRGGFAIINKLYRKTFSENDLALGLITVYKLLFQLESIYLKKLDLDSFDSFLRKDSKISRAGDSTFYKYILEAIEFGFLVFNEKYEVLFLNNFASAVLEIQSIKNLTLKEVLDDEAYSELVSQILTKKMPLVRQELHITRSTRRPLYLGFSIFQIDAESEDTRYVMTFMEISQTKRLQAEIIRMDRMASLGVLASGIAHEIRNPLAGIKAMAQTLEEELAKDDPKLEYIKRIVRQVNRLDELLKSFFSYAKPQRPNPVRCKIPDIVHEVLPLFRRKIKENSITIKEIYSRDLKEVFVDFHQIEQVFFNLIMNAIDATDKGGTLTIRARLPEETQPVIDRRQRIPKLFSDIYNEITITDTGKGMDSNTINHIYNPFFTTKTHGTGLGLSIVYQIILEHGGQIAVESEEGRGTTFKIHLPIYVKNKDDS